MTGGHLKEAMTGDRSACVANDVTGAGCRWGLRAQPPGDRWLGSTAMGVGRWRGWTLPVIALAIVACTDRKDDGGTATIPADTPALPNASTGPPTATANSAASVEPARGGRLVVSGESEVINPWTPAKMQCDSYCMLRARAIYDPLAIVAANGVVRPFLAESITPNAEFTEWTVMLRPGITFTDGTAVDAAAVAANLQATGAGTLMRAALIDIAKNPDGSLWIDEVDARTLVVHTGRGGNPNQPLPWPRFDVLFTLQWGLIASPTWLAEAAADPSQEFRPVGSGPFLVDSFTPRDRLVLARNPAYWRQDSNGRSLPYLDQVEFRVIDDSETAAAALRSGDLDALVTADGATIAGLRGELPMIEQEQFSGTGYLLVDLDKPGPLQDRRVRCALSRAIDREELNDAVSGGIFQPANGLFSPGQEGYLADNGTSVALDVEGARRMLEEYESDTGEAVAVELRVPTAQWFAQMAELIVGHWGDVGVDASWSALPQDALITSALFGTPDFTIVAWRGHAGFTVDEQNLWWNSAGAHPDGQPSLNLGRLRDPIVDDNLALARSSTDPDRRRAAAEAINRQMAEQCYQIPLSWLLWAIPHRPVVHGIEATTLPDGTALRSADSSSGQFRLEEVWREPAG
jgi:peptide/nickel transport system substrate-binding protein